MRLVSIIVPVYNTSKYLEKCLESLKNQTLKNIEIIVVDDGSTDESLKIAKKIAKDDKRIKVFHKQNGGLSSARNYGIEKATGDFIGFVDSDDYVEENMFETLLDMVIENNANMSICGWYVVENDERRKCPFECDRTVLNDEQAIDMLLNHVSFDNFACNKLFHRSLFDDIKFPVGELLEDLSTIYQLIHKAKRVVVDSVPLYYYVLHHNSITSNLYQQVNPEVFQVYDARKNNLLLMYPQLAHKIKSNYFTANKHNFMISLHSKIRYKEFEKDRIKEMRKNIKYVWIDKSIPTRVKISSTLISIAPYLYFKVRK